MNKHWIGRVLVALGLTMSVSAFAAESETVSGVVTYVDATNQTITVRNEETGRYRTYFLTPDSRITSRGSTIALSDIKRGNGVTLSYRRTDRGREITSVRVPSPDQTQDVPMPVTSGEQSISGTITGVRPSKRTITIREASTRERQTLNIPEGTRITNDGEPLSLRDLQRGDRITARYRVTERGPVLVTGTTPEPVQAEPPVAMTELPKTASGVFAYLFAGLGLLTLALTSRGLRRRVRR